MILPHPDEAFEWHETAFGPALICAPLAEVAPHLFTTRAWSLGAARDGGSDAWADVAAALGLPAEALVRLKQVHGRATVVADRVVGRGAPDALPEADIALASRHGRAIAVQSADCVPLLIADRRLGVVAAAHAGWRGLSLGVPGVAVEALAQTFGSRPHDLIAAIGPSVGSCCYEVGPDVRQAFVAAAFPAEQLGRWFLDSPTPIPGNASMPGLPAEQRPGHAYFNGWASARDQLVTAGLADERIFGAGLCTASHPEVLCSYRRDGIRAGRIAGAIRTSFRP
jgi:polyphenol oxidase